MKQKGLIGIIILIFIVLLIFLTLSYIFLAKPYKVVGDKVVAPFKPGEQLLSERISYLFTKPAEGDRVIFTPQDADIDFVGIITKTENQENVTSYTIVSVENGRPWVVSVDKIKRKIYFPIIDPAETKSIVLSLQPTPTPYQDGKSGIMGKIVLGPTCPAVGPGMENECQDKQYQATVAVKTGDGVKEITRFTSDAQGNFKVSLAPGDYLLESVSNNRFPFAKPQSVTVVKGEFTSVTISYDTGIR